jgi:hypothetical protein
MSSPPTPDWFRAAVRRFLVPAAIAIAGMVVVLVVAGSTGAIIGWTLIGLAGILAVGLLFLEVGYSEDRERAGRGAGPPR